jgi:NADH dehydrogenase/NADH:ubiquinone oxidoreductase subunit G
MVNLKEIVQKVVPIRKKEDTTIRLIVQQDVAENVRQLTQAISKLKEKDINNFVNVIERIANTINKRISK